MRVLPVRSGAFMFAYFPLKGRQAYMSLDMRTPLFCICENKNANQLRCNREADQRRCFRYIACTIHLLPKYKISSMNPSSVAVQPGLCRTWSETSKTGFLIMNLIWVNPVGYELTGFLKCFLSYVMQGPFEWF